MAISTALGYDDLPELLTRLTGDEKHDWSSLSTLDVLWVLYDRVLRIDPSTPDDPGRDRFLVSKGHGPAAYYAVLAAKGFISPDQLEGFGTFDSPLGYHPDHVLVPGVEISSGSLGHGLPIAVGVALAGRRVFCLVGDAELDARIATLEAIRGRLTTCIGCGCLSLQTCGLLNPADEASGLGPGAHFLVPRGR